MTVDAGKGFSLPSGPSTLCIDKEEFMKAEFDVDTFVMERRRHVQLETLRDDLNVYLKVLRSAMIELINKDYADFVNLSTNLVGMDKAIGKLTVPLGQLKEEVLSVRTSMDEAIQAVENKLKQQQEIQRKKACLQRLMNITHSVEKIESLLGIHRAEDSGASPASSHGQLSGQLIERVATEFNKLQFYVTKSRGLPLVEKIKPRIANITTTLQYSLEGSFLDGLETHNTDILRQCLRTYALIDKTRDAEALFREHMVKPHMEEVVTEEYLRSNGQGLRGLYEAVLDFVPSKCKILKDVTSGSSGTTETVRGYDFLVNAVWPEIVGNLEARVPSIFAPGNPDSFHQKYCISLEFLTRFESLCGSRASVKRLRDHPSYTTFINKWSLPVYFQIRFQDIAGQLETALVTGFNTAQGDTRFKLNAAATLWRCLGRCWSDQVYLAALCHRLWKLSLQMLSRYSVWLGEVHEEEILRRKHIPLDKPHRLTSSVSSPVLSDMNHGHGDSQRAGSPQPHPDPSQPPVTIGQLVCLIADAETVMSLFPEFFEATVKPRLVAVNVDELEGFQDCLEEVKGSIEGRLPQFRHFVTGDVINQCAVHLKQVTDTPRLYRRTNREVPTKPSLYVAALVKPLRLFLEEHEDALGPSQRAGLVTQVFGDLTQQYLGVTSEVLTSVKKTEDSLKRLKKAKGTEKSAGSHGMSDDDKIRQQLIIDIENYLSQVQILGVEPSSIEGCNKLQELSVEAKAAMTTA